MGLTVPPCAFKIDVNIYSLLHCPDLCPNQWAIAKQEHWYWTVLQNPAWCQWKSLTGGLLRLSDLGQKTTSSSDVCFATLIHSVWLRERVLLPEDWQQNPAEISCLLFHSSAISGNHFPTSQHTQNSVYVGACGVDPSHTLESSTPCRSTEDPLIRGVMGHGSGFHPSLSLSHTESSSSLWGCDSDMIYFRPHSWTDLYG